MVINIILYVLYYIILYYIYSLYTVTAPHDRVAALLEQSVRVGIVPRLHRRLPERQPPPSFRWRLRRDTRWCVCARARAFADDGGCGAAAAASLQYSGPARRYEVCVCVRVCARAHVCVRACVRAGESG